MNTIDKIQIHKGEVLLLIEDIDIAKSSGLDMISSRCLKDALLVLNDQLCYTFEKSIEKCIFPDKWKIATVVPLFKGGVKEEVSNYRPVSLLPIPGKILEKIVHNKMTQFFNKNNSLCDKQNGFRPKHSTINSIVDLTNDIFSDINNGMVTLSVFIDLKKAFDTVNHNILLEKLYYMGIKGDTIIWIKSYLYNRFQKTICNSNLSNIRNIKCGVPQGSILGPLFFLVYINDIQNVMNNCKYQLYADDTVIYCNGKTYEEAKLKLQNVMNKFVDWCGKNALTININKSKIMSFGSRNNIKKSKNINIKINDEYLGNVPTYKYLGIHLDQTLNFKHHSEKLLNILNHKLFMFSKLGNI